MERICNRGLTDRAGDMPLTDHLSAVLTIDHCKFEEPKAVLKNYCDYAGVNNCWVAVNKPINTAKSPYALFSNMCGKKDGGRGSLGFSQHVRYARFPSRSGCRWIDNYGSVFVDDSRFGGEGAGLPIIYHYAGRLNQNGSWPRRPTSVVIRNSWVFTGYNDTKLSQC